MVLIATGSAEAQRRSGQPAFVGCICGLGRIPVRDLLQYDVSV
jgi:hypothetical protein